MFLSQKGDLIKLTELQGLQIGPKIQLDQNWFKVEKLRNLS